MKYETPTPEEKERDMKKIIEHVLDITREGIIHYRSKAAILEDENRNPMNDSGLMQLFEGRILNSLDNLLEILTMREKGILDSPITLGQRKRFNRAPSADASEFLKNLYGFAVEEIGRAHV